MVNFGWNQNASDFFCQVLITTRPSMTQNMIRRVTFDVTLKCWGQFQRNAVCHQHGMVQIILATTATKVFKATGCSFLYKFNAALSFKLYNVTQYPTQKRLVSWGFYDAWNHVFANPKLPMVKSHIECLLYRRDVLAHVRKHVCRSWQYLWISWKGVLEAEINPRS